MLPPKINDFKNVEFKKNIEDNECYWTTCPHYLFINSGAPFTYRGFSF